jgi:hypothetical protein
MACESFLLGGGQFLAERMARIMVGGQYVMSGISELCDDFAAAGTRGADG